MRKLLIILPVASILVLLALALSTAAHAQDVEECSVFINSAPANDRTIELGKDDGVSIRGIAPEGSTRNDVYLVFFGKRFLVTSMASSGGEFQGNTRISDIANVGVGLYELSWESLGPDGEVLCQATGSIRILGSPLSSIAGIAGVAAIAIGLAGLALTLSTTVYAGARWAIKAVARARVKREGEADEEERGRLRPRPSFSITQTLGGTLAGLVLGGGSLTTLQQAAVSPPTVELALQVVLPLTLFGLLAGTLRPKRERRAG